MTVLSLSGYPDRGTPYCPCGCPKMWLDEFHSWVCPHCDLQTDRVQQIQKVVSCGVDVVMNCCVCSRHSGRIEVCAQCAPMIWPHRIINEGAKRLSKVLLPVNSPRASVSP